MPKPSALSFIGIGKETTKGTPVTTTAYIPVTTITPGDNVVYVADQALRASMVDTYNEIQGPVSSEVDLEGPVIPDTFGWPLAGLMGDITTTGASAPFSHAISLKNSSDGQPTSHTIADNYAAACRKYAGIQWAELAVKYTADGVLTWTSKAVGWGSATLSAPTPSFTTIPPQAAWRCTATIGGSSVTYVQEAEIDFKRTATPIFTLQNSQNPYSVFVGDLAVTGKLKLIMEDDTELTRYLTNTQPALVLDLQQGVSAALVEVKFQMTKCAYTNADIDRGSDYVVLNVDFTALGNTTDAGASGGYSPIKATLQNAIASGTYI